MAILFTWIKRKLGVGSPNQPPDNKASQNGQRETPTLTEFSRSERKALSQDTDHETQMREWTQQMDAWFAKLYAYPATWEAYAFLQRLLAEDKTGQAPSAAMPANRQVEVSAQALYRTFFAGEHNGDIEYFFQRIVQTNTVEQIHQHQKVIENLAKMYGEETATRALPRIAALTSGQEHRNGQTAPRTPFSVLGLDVETGMEVMISLKDRLQGMYIIGATGCGKTTILIHSILSDTHHDMGVCVIEPHNSLVRAVIAGIPSHKLKDVILVDLADADAPVGNNLFECPPPRTIKSIAATASFLSHVFEKVWGAGTETPRLMMVLRAVTRTLIDNSPNATFAEIPLLFSDPTVRAKLMENLTNSSIASFWEGYNRRSQRDKDELVASTLNKVLSFLDNEMIRNIVGQARSTIDFRTVMDEGKILLVLLNPQFEEASRLVGSVIIGKLLMSAFSRSDTPEEERRPFALYVDEFQRFASEDLSVFLAEARKFRIASTIANQTLEQLDEANRAAALQAGNLVAFRVSGLDSKSLAPSYDATPQLEVVGQEPIRAPAVDPLSHLVRHGSPEPVISAFISEYLMPFHALMQKVGHAIHPFQLGCALMNSYQVIEGQKRLNDALAACMREGRPDVTIDPLALLVLGGAVDSEITNVFFHDLRYEMFGTIEMKGFYDNAYRLGRPGFLKNTQVVNAFIKQHDRAGGLFSPPRSPATKFITMLRSLRSAMAVLAERPLMVDTGLYKDVLRPRTYSDTQAEIGNFLANQPNHQARVKLLSGEHVVKTLPPPASLPEHEIQARISAIKQRMLLDGISKPVALVEAEIRERQEKLRDRPQSEAPPPSSTTGRPPRRFRPRPPTDT